MNFIKIVIVVFSLVGFLSHSFAGDKDCDSLIATLFKRGSIIGTDYPIKLQKQIDDILYAYSNGFRIELKHGYESISGEVFDINEEEGVVAFVLKSRIFGERKIYLSEQTYVKVISQKDFEEKLELALSSLGKIERDNFILVKKAFKSEYDVEVRSGYSSTKGKIIDIVVDDNSGIVFFVESKWAGVSLFYLIDQSIKIKKIDL